MYFWSPTISCSQSPTKREAVKQKWSTLSIRQITMESHKVLLVWRKLISMGNTALQTPPILPLEKEKKCCQTSDRLYNVNDSLSRISDDSVGGICSAVLPIVVSFLLTNYTLWYSVMICLIDSVLHFCFTASRLVGLWEQVIVGLQKVMSFWLQSVDVKHS